MQNYEAELDQGHSTSLRSIDIVWKNAVKYVKITCGLTNGMCIQF